MQENVDFQSIDRQYEIGKSWNYDIHTDAIFLLSGSTRRTSEPPKMTSILLACAALVAFTCNVRAISSSWRPIVPSHVGSAGILHQDTSIFANAPTQTLYDVDSPHHLLLPSDHERCSLYKVSMTQQLYFEVDFAEHAR